MAVPADRDVFGMRVPDNLVGPLMLAARLMLAFEFMLYGTRKYLHPENIYSLIETHGLPGELVYGVIPLQFGCGWLVAFGLLTRPASLALFGFCVFAPSIFWTNSLDNFVRDWSAAGGWMLLAIYGPGPWSLDAKFKVPLQTVFGPVRRDDAYLPLLIAACRAFISCSFIIRGVRDAGGSGQLAEYLAAQNYPPSVLMLIAFVQIAGGLMVLFGWRTKIGALALCILSLVFAFTIHSIVDNLALGRESFAYSIDALFNGMGNMISSFGKDLGTAGAALVLYVWGPGPMSLDARFRFRARPAAA
jgi:putative oxidoreductase